MISIGLGRKGKCKGCFLIVSVFGSLDERRNTGKQFSVQQMENFWCLVLLPILMTLVSGQISGSPKKNPRHTVGT